MNGLIGPQKGSEAFVCNNLSSKRMINWQILLNAKSNNKVYS